MSLPVYYHKWFNNYEELAAQLKFWDIDFRQLEGGKKTNAVTQIYTEDILLSSANFSGKTIQTGNSPSSRTFAFLIDNQSHILWRNKPTDDSYLMIFPVNGEFEVITHSPQTNVITVSIPDELVAKYVDEINFEQYQNILSRFTTIQLPALLLESLRANCLLYMRKLKIDIDQSILPSSCTLLENIILNLVECTLFVTQRETVGFPQSRSPLWKKLDEIITPHFIEPVTVQELTEITGVSRRSVQRYFNTKFKLSPKTYLIISRLNKVRKELIKNGSENRSISDIANEWGFWHMGQFAADYRKLFDELPSETKIIERVVNSCY